MASKAIIGMVINKNKRVGLNPGHLHHRQAGYQLCCCSKHNSVCFSKVTQLTLKKT
jgi:hypothetical protein